MSFPFPVATIPDLPLNLTPPNTSLVEISNAGVSESTSLAAILTATTPLTTKGDIFAYSTQNDRLPVGTNGQILTSNSAQAIGLEWIDPPQVSPLTTKGDLYTFDTDNQRLPVGTNGQVLVANSATATGLEWQTGAGQTPWLQNVDAAGFNLFNLAYMESNALNPATIGAVRLGDTEGIFWRDDGNTTNVGFNVSSSALTLVGIPTLSMSSLSTINAPNAAVTFDFLQILSGLDMGGGGITSLSSIEMDPSGIILFNGVSTQWIQGTAAGVEINAQTGGAIDLKINNGIEYFFNATQFNAGNKLIKAVLTPVDGTDAANKSYVDNLVNGLAWKDSARATTTGNIVLSAPQVIDTVSVIAGDRVLVKDQTLGQENGLYQVNAGAWTRTADADTEADLLNMSVFIQEGAVNGATGWTLTTPAPIVVDTTVLNYAQIGATPSNPLTTKGDLFGYDTGNNRVPVGTDNQFLMANSAVALGVSYSLVNNINLTPGKFDNIQSVATDFQILTDDNTSNLVLEKNSTVPAPGTISSIQSWDDDSLNNRIRFARINTTAVSITSGAWAASMAFQMYGPLGFSAFMIMNNGNDGDLSVLADINMFNNNIFNVSGTGGITFDSG